ncbi:MAG: DUF262 domain-containing protein [Gammaproteobacteria bacterium]|nr:DUF262 domain-containing protein [Gammaproteobacteria bacterium]
MKEGSTLSFIELMNEVEVIQIPILQRDYAQGRDEAAEVRRQFLGSIKDALLEDNLEQPLDLDFVYGNFEGRDGSAFSVLDGQQRLTTLFLLHWYLAMKDGCLASFQASFVSDIGSKFTYKTRVSAAEFFNALAIANDVNLNGTQSAIAEQIIDKQWFFLSWKSDPTVQSCLTMLNAMHHQFSSCDDVLYERLINTTNPRIVFQYLNLESFGLSDELYIKMNARGKPLTSFENFKAWLCGKLDDTTTGKVIEKKIDKEWTDIFWKISLELDKEFDELYLRFFNLMAFFRACERVEGSFVYLDKPRQIWLRKLRVADGYLSVTDHEKFESFDEESIHRLESILDYFFVNLDNDSVFKVLTDGLTSNDYVSQSKFYAYIKFVQQAMESETWTKENDENLTRWKRVTDNLINNHRIDELSPFVPVIRSLSELSTHSNDLYAFLSGSGMDSGFASEQREEESLKAGLILEDKKWEELLTRFECHPYLKGKVGFILDMVANADGENISQARFEEAASKVSVLLSDDILRTRDFLLERALLALDDYLVNESGYRYSFCVPNRMTYRERSENWFKVAKKSVFNTLVNAVEVDIEESLKNIIANADCGGWRQLLIENPEAIRYCTNRLVYKDSNLIHLLSKSSFRGYHAELRTFVLEKIMNTMKKGGELPEDITGFHYVAVYGSESPYLRVILNKKEIYSLYYGKAGFYINSIPESEGEEITVSMPMVLVDLLNKIFPNKEAK